MDTGRIDAILALLTEGEVGDALRFVDVWERLGGLSPDEAKEWRRRIPAMQGFLTLRETMRPS